jgi:hypothetical protein
MQIPSPRPSVPAPPPKRVRFAEPEAIDITELPPAPPSPAGTPPRHATVAPPLGTAARTPLPALALLRDDPYDGRWACGVLVGGALGGLVVGAITGSMFGPLTGAQTTAEALRMFIPAGLVAGLGISGAVVLIKRARRPSTALYQV